MNEKTGNLTKEMKEIEKIDIEEMRENEVASTISGSFMPLLCC